MRKWLAWNVLFPLHEYAKGHPTFEILRQMEAADRLTRSELDRLTARKLRDLVSYCHAHVPHIGKRMQAAGIEPKQISGPDDLRRLPITSKADIREHRHELRSELPTTFTSFATGGSTGEPLIFDLAARRIASRVACRQRVSRWWGVSVGDPELALWGSPIELTNQDLLRKLRDKLLSTRLLSAFEMNDETMSVYLDVLERWEWRQIFAYPSAIYLLCLHARRERRNLRGLGLKAVFVTGEVLFPHQRELISDTLNCPVADGYGGRDSGFIAHECPQGGMHVLSDAVIVEIVDAQGCSVPPGEPGEIVVTDLYSHESPFIRYATGDVGVLSSRLCRCGRALPLMERIEGRSNDCIFTPDGRIVNSLAVIYAVREVEGIKQFKIRQKAPSSFYVQIVTDGDFPADGEDRIRNEWTKLLRSRVDVHFEHLAHIPPEKSGKFRHVISEIPIDQKLHTTMDDYVRS